MTAVKFYDGYGYWENGRAITHENHDDWFEEDGSAFFWCGYHDIETCTVCATVQLNGSEEWISTNAITFVPLEYGQIGSYDFTGPDTVTVQRGEMVTFTFSAADQATHYWADAFSADERHESFNPMTYNPDGTTTVTMSTAALPEGEYEIWGRAGGDPGWRWVESEHCVHLTVTGEMSMDQPDIITPASLTVIEAEAFEGIAAQVVRISDQVTSIGPRAFADSALRQIWIPSSVTDISESAFDGCDQVIIFCRSGSTAHAWADDHQSPQIICVPLD